MNRAYIHGSISTSIEVAELSILGQLIFERMLPHSDFQGRLPGHPLKVKAMVIPMIDTSAEKVAEQLQKMHDLGLIIWYEARGDRFIQLVAWWKFQPLRFAHPSKFPPPEGWRDRLRYNDPHNPKILVEENWVAREPVGRPKNIGSNEPTQESYIGSLDREPTQDSCIGAYEGVEIHPSASALALKTKTLLSEPAVSDGSNGDARKPNRPRKRITYPNDFNEFWSAYPRPVGKMAAYEAWSKITKDGYPPEDVLRATQEFSRQMEREKRDESKIRHPERFLKKDFWKEFCLAD